MRLHGFSSEEEYIRYQTKVTQRKFKNKRPVCYTHINVINRIRESGFLVPVPVGLCHGVRTGDELDYWERVFGGSWTGSEITPELCDGVRIIEHDFRKTKKEWEGSFDVVYSNSLDHSSEPFKTVKVWANQLKNEDSFLCVEWSKWSNAFRSNNKADAFAASLQEYVDLLSTVGRVEEILNVPKNDVRKSFDREIIMVRKVG